MSDNHINCPIWGTPATIIKEYQGAASIDSPRTGGAYVIEGWTIVRLKMQTLKLEDATKVRLTSWLIEQRRLGEKYPPITLETIGDAKQRRDLPIYERMDRFLRYLSHIEPFVGGGFVMDDAELLHAQAWSESRMIATVMRESEAEIRFFLDSLAARGWINMQKKGTTSP